MRAKLQPLRRALTNPTLSAISNAWTSISALSFFVAIASAVVGRVFDQPTLFLIAIGLAALGLLRAAWAHFYGCPHKDVETSTLPSTRKDSPAPAPFSRIQPADKALQRVQGMLDAANRRMLALIEAELVEIIDEGVRLRGDEFSGNPTWAEFDAWRGPTVVFVEAVFGKAEKQRLLEVESNGSEVRDHVASVLEWLRALRDRPESWQVQIDGPEAEAAIKARRRPLLSEALTSLMQEGINLVAELSASVEPEATEDGVVKVSGGDPPKEWQDKADTFRQKAWNLLAGHHPALLKVYEDACNAEIQKAREARVTSDQTEAATRRSGLEKALYLANRQQGGPKWEVEITLDGLSAARLQLDEGLKARLVA
jgi:hypothetical protein